MQKRWREGAVGERVVWQAAVRHSRSTSLQRAAIWATQHQNSSVSPPLQTNRRQPLASIADGQTPRGCRLATPKQSFHAKTRVDSHEQPRNGIENTLTNESQPTRAYAGACGTLIPILY